MYLYFAILVAVYVLIFFIKSGDITSNRLLMETNPVFLLASLFGGGYLFVTIYNDDLNAKTLPTLIGFGMKKTTIILSKLIIYVTMTILIFLGTFILFYLTFIAFGFEITNDMLKQLTTVLFSNFFQLLAFSSIASIVVYGTQKASMSIVTFVLLVTTFVSSIIIMFLGQNNILKDYMIMPLVSNMLTAPTITTITLYLIYMVIFTLLSIFAFHKKDLEF
ncbi:MAG: hypothetical protein LBQ59_01700 [Candidatus Peribacteria bacterium]|jgi:ABC-type transport system involved in multi-copper enzyme maturation permease subunit|nr:hypothetical protein [Candidatus Peribacteria bacterium]